MKVLFITINREHRVAFNLFTPLQTELAKLCDVTIHEKQVGVRGRMYQKEFFKNPESYNKELNHIEINTHYDVVITDSLFAYLGEDWDLITIPKMTLIEDQHGQCMDIVKMGDKVHKFDYFLVRYRDAFYKNHPTINRDRTFWTPHSINTDFFKDYEEKKDIPFLLTGNIGKEFYPLRAKVYNELKDSPFFKRVDRPLEGVTNQWPMGRDYARLINRSLISFACNSSLGYPIMKIFEIPACRTVLCCDYTKELGDLGFVPNVNMIPIAMGTDIKTHATGWISSGRQLTDMMDAGYDLIQERHTVQIRAKELYDFIRKI